MRRLTVFAVFLLVLFFGLSTPVQAAAEQRLYVVLDFENMDTLIYNAVQDNRDLFNDTIFPQIFVENLENYLDVTYSPLDAELKFNDSARSMQASFSLSGSDIINFTLNRETMARTYQVNTDWRTFKVDIKDENGSSIFSLNLADFSEPVAQWEATNYTLHGSNRTAYFYEYFNPLVYYATFYFVLPAEATNPQVDGDTITYELPPAPGDVLLNSPFLVMGAIIAIAGGFVLYRKIRKIARETLRRGFSALGS